MIIHHCYVLWILLIRNVYDFQGCIVYSTKYALTFRVLSIPVIVDLMMIIEDLPREISSPSNRIQQDTRSFQSAYIKTLTKKLWALIAKAGLEIIMNLRELFRASRMLKTFFHIFYNKIPCIIVSVQQANRWMSRILTHTNLGLQVLHTFLFI